MCGAKIVRSELRSIIVLAQTICIPLIAGCTCDSWTGASFRDNREAGRSLTCIISGWTANITMG